MSINAITWVFEKSEAKGNDRLVLLAIADAASREGEASMQSVTTLARMAHCSEMTVRRSIKTLLEMGEIEFVGQSSARYKYTNIYRMPGVAEAGDPYQTDRGTPNTGVTQTKDIPKNLSSTEGRRREFDEWWSLYPKKVGKQAAFRAFTKATKTVDPSCILSGLRQQIDFLGAKKTDGFCPDPASWLNAGRWDDEVTPRQSRPARLPEESSAAYEMRTGVKWVRS